MNDILTEKQYQKFIIDYLKKNNGYTYRGLVVHDGASIKPVIAVQGRRG